jgi:hypothetical protein
MKLERSICIERIMVEHGIERIMLDRLYRLYADKGFIVIKAIKKKERFAY